MKCAPSNFALAQRLRAILISCSLLLLAASAAPASPVAVRYKQGLVHGFLVLTTLDGVAIAQGELLQIAKGDQVTNHLTFHFKDGSVQEETTIYSQRNFFRLIRYRLVQRGPSFKNPIDISLVTATGEVTIHSVDDKGNAKDSTQHMNLPPDLANGMVPMLLTNVPSGTQEIDFSMLATTSKPRVIKLKIAPDGSDRFTFGGDTREAVHYVIKINLGGLAGAVAPMIGKQPPDNHVWIFGGEAPAFVKSESLAYEGGPMWRTELASPTWPHETPHDAGRDSSQDKSH
jgi:hypothetical protein